MNGVLADYRQSCRYLSEVARASSSEGLSASLSEVAEYFLLVSLLSAQPSGDAHHT